MNTFATMHDKMKSWGIPDHDAEASGSAFYSAASLKGKPVPERQWRVP